MSPEDPLFKRLEDRSRTFSKNHKVLAKYVLANYQRVAFVTIKQLAHLSGVSEATIVRFVKAIDFKGYPAFQKEVRRIVRVDLKGTDRFKLTSQYPQSDRSPLSRIIQKELENISFLRENFNSAEFHRAVQALRGAKEILVVGTRSTASLACHLWFGLTKLGSHATRAISISSETYDRIDRLPSKAWVVVIGFPRYLKALVDFLGFVQKRGFKTITVTDNPLSPLRGDIHLCTPAESASFVAFHCAPLILLNHLLNEMSMGDKKKTLTELNRFESFAEERKLFFKE